MEFGGEGAEDSCHHNVVQPNPIDGWVSDVGEDMVVQDVSTKHEEHKVAPPLVVGWWGFQNDRDHRLYVLDVDSLHVQMHDEGDIDRAIITIVLGECDPLSHGELLFHVTSDDLLLPSEGGDTLTHTGLV
jgi:hypothetical protein